MTENNDLPPLPPQSTSTPASDPYVPASTPAAATPINYAGGIETNKDARTWGMMAHLSAIVAGFVALPFVGPLVVWLVKKDEHPFVNDQGKEALNFQITVAIALLIAIPTMCIGIGFALVPLIGLVALVFAIIGGIKANEGVAYRYPFAIRLIK